MFEGWQNIVLLSLTVLSSIFLSDVTKIKMKVSEERNNFAYIYEKL